MDRSLTGTTLIRYGARLFAASGEEKSTSDSDITRYL